MPAVLAPYMGGLTRLVPQLIGWTDPMARCAGWPVATMALAACSPVGLARRARPASGPPAKTAQDAPDNADHRLDLCGPARRHFVSIARRMGVPMAALAAENRCRCPT
jgi:hypothetical protein